MTLSIDEFLRAASCCICSLSASSAFATWASSPTDGARFCCHFASQHSVRYRHKLNQKYPPIILLAIASCALTVVPRWWSSRDWLRLRSNFAPRLSRSRLPH